MKIMIYTHTLINLLQCISNYLASQSYLHNHKTFMTINKYVYLYKHTSILNITKLFHQFYQEAKNSIAIPLDISPKIR